MSARIICTLVFCLSLVACKTREEKIFQFKINRGANVRLALETAFGRPDTTIAFCNKDTAYLYRVESGCVEWKTLHTDSLRYQVQLNPTCTSEEGRYIEVEDSMDNEIVKKWKKELDSALIAQAVDSIICVSAIGHWNNYIFCFSKKDTGHLAELYHDIVDLEIRDKKSIGSQYCRGENYIVETKLGDFKKTIYLGSVNFPDSSYSKLVGKLKEANKIHYERRGFEL